MNKHVTIRITGVVQGVYFRASTKEKADALQLRGFVRNEPDGSVYVEAEGEEQSLHSFIEWCHQGPARAKVDKCDVREGAFQNYGDFVIRRA